jgi:hypothetical protein
MVTDIVSHLFLFPQLVWGGGQEETVLATHWSGRFLPLQGLPLMLKPVNTCQPDFY